MTELPTLQAALRETAERTYPRRRRPLIPALLVAAAAAAALLVIRDRDGGQPSEVAATPTPAISMPPPGSATRPPVSTAQPRDLRIAFATPIDRARRKGAVRAWDVPALGGRVTLIRERGSWCIGVPGGKACGGATRDAISLQSGASTYAAILIAPAVRQPRIAFPDGGTRQLAMRQGGLLVLTGVPAGSRITLYDASRAAHTEPFG